MACAGRGRPRRRRCQTPAMTVEGCPNCAHIEEAEAGRNPFAIAGLRAGYVTLTSCQYYPGAAFYVARQCVAELWELDPADHQVHFAEMAAVARAFYDEFGARKMNYEALGN